MDSAVFKSLLLVLACGSTIAAKSTSLPASGLTTNGVAVGWLPSNGNASEGVTSPRYTMADINSNLGAMSSTYGLYSHITGDLYNGYELFEEYDDVITSGAVFVASIMPVLDSGFSGITLDLAAQVASVVQNFTDSNVTVWLRFGHEMNWYTDPSASPRYYGTPAEFVIAWKNVASAVSNNSNVLMFWSPNSIGDSDASVLDEWYPGDDVVDLVGIDCYPSGSQQFGDCYSNFYQYYSANKEIPFAIGETGAAEDYKENWLSQLVGQSTGDYPNYISMSWFEYDKGDDFRLVEAGEDILKQTVATLEPSNS